MNTLPVNPHLDPDLVRGALRERHPDWRPIFGQSGAAEVHLRNQGVGELQEEQDLTRNGDSPPLFLFFGWYRHIFQDAQARYTYVPLNRQPQFHSIFGWLQVSRKVNFAGRRERENFARNYPWAAAHPHVSCSCMDGQPNALYIAPKPDSEDDHLILNGQRTNLNASGMFSTFNPDVHRLSMLQGRPMSQWRLPIWFHHHGAPTLTYHRDPTRWHGIEGDPKHIRLQTVGVGQEFVLDTDVGGYDQTLIGAWVKRIVASGIGPQREQRSTSRAEASGSGDALGRLGATTDR